MQAVLDFYAAPGPSTQADGWLDQCESLPHDVPALCRLVQGVMLHPVEAHHYGVRIARARLRELALGSVRAMFERLRELDATPVGISRPARTRVLGNCRDFATLLCALLRYHRIPARVRYGFATYFAADFYTDHVVCEYWKAEEQRWILVDALLDDVLRRVYAIAADPLDLAPPEFVGAGSLWRQYRLGRVDPASVGLFRLGPAGPEFIEAAVLHDVAALNKDEPLCQDVYGLRVPGGDNSDGGYRQLLDTLATWTVNAEASFNDLQAAFTRQILHAASPMGSG